MAQIAKSAAPPTAILLWCDGLFLYAEIPGDPPYIHSESICEAGLWKMLNLLRQKAPEHAIGSARKVDTFVPKQPAAKVVATEEQRASAREVLRKVGLLP